MSNEREYVIRRGEVVDIPLMYVMLFEAAATNPEIAKLDREVALSLPQVRKYVEGWGRDGDQSVVASEPTGKPLGAAWFRLFPADDPGYGFVSEGIPELTIGVVGDARGRGIGSALMQRAIDIAKEEGYESLSLSVEKNSNAVGLYEKFGFVSKGTSEHRKSSVTMVLDLTAV
ncbi:MAG: GNAT family N-acetyltransferase [Fimbriimonadales bacterium]